MCFVIFVARTPARMRPVPPAGFRRAVVPALAAMVAIPGVAGAAPEPASDRDRVVVTLSNGETAEGTFAFSEGRSLEIFDVEKSKRFSVDPAEIVRIAVTAEEEKLEQGWMFKEEGNHDKVKLPYRYPVRKLLTEVTLTGGGTLRGHATGVFYVETGGGSKRFFLLANQKGEKGQSLEDLAYVRQVVLTNRAPAAGAGTSGTIRAPLPAAVVSMEREMSFQPPFAGLLAGRYDVFLFGGATIRYGLSGDPLGAEDRKALDAKIASVEEFFPHKRIVDAARRGGGACALVELTRPGESHDQGWRYARWEVWTFEPTQQGWDIRKRLFLHRERYPADKPMPSFAYAPDPSLRGVAEYAEVK